MAVSLIKQGSKYQFVPSSSLDKKEGGDMSFDPQVVDFVSHFCDIHYDEEGMFNLSIYQLRKLSKYHESKDYYIDPREKDKRLITCIKIEGLLGDNFRLFYLSSSTYGIVQIQTDKIIIYGSMTLERIGFHLDYDIAVCDFVLDEDKLLNVSPLANFKAHVVMAEAFGFEIGDFNIIAPPRIKDKMEKLAKAKEEGNKLLSESRCIYSSDFGEIYEKKDGIAALILFNGLALAQSSEWLYHYNLKYSLLTSLSLKHIEKRDLPYHAYTTEVINLLHQGLTQNAEIKTTVQEQMRLHPEKTPSPYKYEVNAETL